MTAINQQLTRSLWFRVTQHHLLRMEGQEAFEEQKVKQQ